LLRTLYKFSLDRYRGQRIETQSISLVNAIADLGFEVASRCIGLAPERRETLRFARLLRHQQALIASAAFW